MLCHSYSDLKFFSSYKLVSFCLDLQIKKMNFYFLGKVFPKLHRRTEYAQSAISLSTSDDDGSTQMISDGTDEEISSPTADYVFRIVFLADR
jgi:hypothetical protein